MEVHDAQHCLRGKDVWSDGSIALPAKSAHSSLFFEILLSPPTAFQSDFAFHHPHKSLNQGEAFVISVCGLLKTYAPV